MSFDDDHCCGVSGWVVERVIRQGIVPIHIPQCICMNREGVDKYFESYKEKGFSITIEQDGCDCQTRIVAEKDGTKLIASVVPVAH